MRNPTGTTGASKSCILQEDENGVQTARSVIEKKVELEHVASCDVDQSNEHPLGHVLSKLAALEGWKEKFPAYRGSVGPTHFQKQVSWGT